MKRQRTGAEVMESARAQALMQIIEHVVARHNRGECRLDEETLKLFEVAKSIKRAKSAGGFLKALDELAPTKINSWWP